MNMILKTIDNDSETIANIEKITEDVIAYFTEKYGEERQTYLE